MTSLCDPCRAKYDYIGHLETLEDINEIQKSLYGKNVTVEINHRNVKKGDGFCPWGDLTKEEKDLITNVYRADFKAFGYDITDLP